MSSYDPRTHTGAKRDRFDNYISFVSLKACSLRRQLRTYGMHGYTPSTIVLQIIHGLTWERSVTSIPLSSANQSRPRAEESRT